MSGISCLEINTGEGTGDEAELVGEDFEAAPDPSDAVTVALTPASIVASIFGGGELPPPQAITASMITGSTTIAGTV
ncbi:hypothetical protein M1N56_07970 [Dehalococcoidia bacterium]|nr:hypothetical protein [Dehalococcoidia bacterium]